jgi:hypothetical protein
MHSNRRLCEFAALLCLASAIAAFPITLISPFNAGFMTVYLPVTVVMTLNVIFTIEGVISAKRRMMAREEHEAGDDIRWNSAMLNITLEVALVLCVWGFCHISGYTHYQNFIYLMWYCVGFGAIAVVVTYILIGVFGLKREINFAAQLDPSRT